MPTESSTLPKHLFHPLTRFTYFDPPDALAAAEEITAYDAAYLALAQRLPLPLFVQCSCRGHS